MRVLLKSTNLDLIGWCCPAILWKTYLSWLTFKHFIILLICHPWSFMFPKLYIWGKFLQLIVRVHKLHIFCFTLPAGSGPVQAAETAGEPDVSTLRPRKLPPSQGEGGGGGGGRPLQEAGGGLLHAPGEVPHAGEELAPPPLLEPQGCIHGGKKRPMHLLSEPEFLNF